MAPTARSMLERRVDTLLKIPPPARSEAAKHELAVLQETLRMMDDGDLVEDK